MTAEIKKKLMWDDKKLANATQLEQGTNPHARMLLKQAGLDDDKYPVDAPLKIFDNCCGTGFLPGVIHETLKSRDPATFSIQCGDFSDAMVTKATERVAEAGYANTSVSKVDAQDTHLPSNSFTHYLTNFGPMVVPNPDALLSECRRSLVPGGVCGFTTWRVVGWTPPVRQAIELIRATAAAVATSGPASDSPDTSTRSSSSSSASPSASNMVEDPKFWANLPLLPSDQEVQQTFAGGHWDDPSWIREQLSSGGHIFDDIVITPSRATTTYRSVAELKGILTMTLGMIVNNFWTKEQQDTFGGQRLYDRVMAALEEIYAPGGEPEGGIVWDWEALVTTCRKPMSG